MALLRDMVCKRWPTMKELVAEEIKSMNLKILKRLTIKFDPFRNDVKHIRDFSHLIHSNEARSSNHKYIIKTELLSNKSEHTLTFDLTNGHSFVFKCENLKLLDIFQLINKHITPLSPVEEEIKIVKTKNQTKRK